MKRAVYAFLFFFLVAEPPDMWHGVWKTPLSLASLILFETKIGKLTISDLCLIAFLVFSPKPRAQEVARPMRLAMLGCAGTLALIFAMGVMRGGDWRQALFQVRPLISALVFGFGLIRVLRTPEDFLGMGRVLVYAGLWRSFMCVAFYWFVVRAGRIDPIPETMTTHGDTTLFVTALLAVILYAFETRTRAARRFAYWSVPLILAAIQFNNRRLAWVSLIGALVSLYFIYPPSEMRDRINKLLKRASPFILVYLMAGKVAVDSGANIAIFKPIASIFSSSDPNNPSTKSRLAENMGLLVTFMPDMYLGTGFGHEYIEVDNSLAATDFLQYRYVPHNSALGFIAFAGLLGFLGMWAPFPLTILLNARAYRSAREPVTRTVASLAMAEAVIFMSQAYGDMGLFVGGPLLTVSVAWAAAARLAQQGELRLQEERMQASWAAQQL